MLLLKPKNNCKICNRLYNYLQDQGKKFPHWHNKPVQGIGSLNSDFLIVGLAPGLKGANKTGIPFTSDFSGELIIKTLRKYNFLGEEESFNNTMNFRITNAIKCLPPKNKPNSLEINNCNNFLKSEIKNMQNLKIILSLGSIAHKGILKTFEKKLDDFKFKHMAIHKMNKRLILVNSYHCSRYNLQTKRLSIESFEKIFKLINKKLSCL